jgi:hypothetical protein
MDFIFTGISGIAGLVMIICYLIVLFTMFKNNHVLLAIVLFFLCGIGGLIAFIFGWMKSTEWNIKTTMIIWTIAALATVLGGAMGGGVQILSLNPWKN